MLSFHQTGCKYFPGIHKVNGHVYPTNHAASEALGLLGNDQEWLITLEEAATYAMSSELCALFVQMLIHCEVADPQILWDTYILRTNVS